MEELYISAKSLSKKIYNYTYIYMQVQPKKHMEHEQSPYRFVKKLCISAKNDL